VPEIWVSVVFVKVLLLLLRLTINEHSKIKKKDLLLNKPCTRALWPLYTCWLGENSIACRQWQDWIDVRTLLWGTNKVPNCQWCHLSFSATVSNMLCIAELSMKYVSRAVLLAYSFWYSMLYLNLNVSKCTYPYAYEIYRSTCISLHRCLTIISINPPNAICSLSCSLQEHAPKTKATRQWASMTNIVCHHLPLFWNLCSVLVRLGQWWIERQVLSHRWVMGHI